VNQQPTANPKDRRRNSQLRQSLTASQREGVASSLMTGICDNYFTAFAIHLHASIPQIGLLTAIPQLLGAMFQLFSIWLGYYLQRRRLIIFGATFQAGTAACLLALALWNPAFAVWILIALAVCYHAAGNFIQPHWRALMGRLVPAASRGRFFARRSGLSMLTAFSTFVGGGVLLNLFAEWDKTQIGFALLFAVALLGRICSVYLLGKMHDPAENEQLASGDAYRRTLLAMREALSHKSFRHYSIFLAAMQGMVALSGPFFSVYMLRVLEFSYFEFTITVGTSFLVQFLTLNAWGRVSDHLGNRVVMIATSVMLPLLPVLWLFSDNFYYLLLVQLISGIAWGGFNLSTGNFIYDLRPPHAHFATYSALQSGLSAIAIFIGAVAGGYIVTAIPAQIELFTLQWSITQPLLVLFAISGFFRLLVALWYLPRAEELRVLRRPRVLELVFRIARFTPISGIDLDVMTVKKKEPEQ
jgi:MFS family permease